MQHDNVPLLCLRMKGRNGKTHNRLFKNKTNSTMAAQWGQRRTEKRKRKKACLRPLPCLSPLSPSFSLNPCNISYSHPHMHACHAAPIACHPPSNGPIAIKAHSFFCLCCLALLGLFGMDATLTNKVKKRVHNHEGWDMHPSPPSNFVCCVRVYFLPSCHFPGFSASFSSFVSRTTKDEEHMMCSRSEGYVGVVWCLCSFGMSNWTGSKKRRTGTLPKWRDTSLQACLGFGLSLIQKPLSPHVWIGRWDNSAHSSPASRHSA